MVTVCTGVIIGIGVASCLALVSSQNRSIVRSQSWNGALPLAEAGVEEAFTHLNDDPGNPSANGWTAQVSNGQTVYTRRRDFSDGTHYSVIISNATTLPAIFSQGSVPAPLGSKNVTRTVLVTTKPKVTESGPAVGIFTKNAINLGSDFLIDSCDSTDPQHSSNGLYPINEPSKLNANGNLASLSTLAGQLTLADSKIFGHLYTTATGGYTVGTHVMVGDQAFQSNPANDGKIEAGYYSNDLNTTIPDVAPPSGYSSFLPVTYLGDSKKGPTSFTYGGVTYT